ncbi:MAG: DUF4276 family protein [Fimbriimonadales bacterium]
MKPARYLIFFVEEPSMESFLRSFLPRFIGQDIELRFYVFQGKHDMLKKLKERLTTYGTWLTDEYRIFILIDQDDDDCHKIKQQIEAWVRDAGLASRSHADPNKPSQWQVVTRIVITELEAWYFGDWEAVRMAYPRVSKDIHRKASYRVPDQITNPSETLEQIMQRAKYFSTGLRKIELASTLGSLISPKRNRSGSFQKFYEALMEAAGS